MIHVIPTGAAPPHGPADAARPNVTALPPSLGPVPPLSPVLLAGLALRPVPTWLLQPALDLALDRVVARHPDLFERLDMVGDPTYLIDIVDLPFAFLLRPNPPSLRLVRGDGEAPTATIRAPLTTLLALMQGEVDGDALFFTRDLTVEGDTVAVLALRNAIDGAGIDLIDEIAALLGPLGGPVRHLLVRGEALFRAATGDLETLRWAAIAPVVRQREADALRLAALERQVAALSRRRRGED